MPAVQVVVAAVQGGGVSALASADTSLSDREIVAAYDEKELIKLSCMAELASSITIFHFAYEYVLSTVGFRGNLSLDISAFPMHIHIVSYREASRSKDKVIPVAWLKSSAFRLGTFNMMDDCLGGLSFLELLPFAFFKGNQKETTHFEGSLYVCSGNSRTYKWLISWIRLIS